MGKLQADSNTNPECALSPTSLLATQPEQDCNLKVLQNLVHLLSHRLSSPLTSIRGYTDLLNDTLGGNDQRKMAISILDATQSMERVLKNLRRYSQYNDPVVDKVCLYELSQSLEAINSDAPEKRFEVAINRGVNIVADEVLLRQALISLLQNAKEAPGGNVRLTIDVNEAENTVSFCVENEGAIGIDVKQEQLFQPFYTTKSHNLGIGLTLARRIARAHGGEARLVYSDPGRGTCFEICIPVNP